MEIKDLLAFLVTTKQQLSQWLHDICPSLRIDIANPEQTYVPSVLQLQ